MKRAARQRAALGITIAGTAATFLVTALAAFQVIQNGAMRYMLGGWPPPWGIEYVLDHLSVFICLTVSLIVLVVLIYPARAGLYFVFGKGMPPYGLVMLLLAGLLGVVVTGDLFNLYVFLEIYSLASYALITLGGNKAVFAAFRYLILGTVAGCFYLLGVGFLYFSVGTLNMADMARLLSAAPLTPSIVTGMVLIIVALGIKMALFPLHVWLPDAHSYAPPVMAAILASVQIEVAAYALLRMLLSVFDLGALMSNIPILPIIGWCSAAGILVGSIMAIAQKDFKRMLAYSTVGQIGYIGLGIGLANPLALIGGLLHVLNHAFMKSCLFLVAGAIKQQTGLTEIPQLAGLGRRMPWLMTAFTIAALSMVGIPPTCGFFSKYYLVLGSLDAGNWVFVAVLLVSTLLTGAYFFRIIEKVFTNQGETGEPPDTHKEPSRSLLFPVLFLAGGILVLGLANSLVVKNLLEPVTEMLKLALGGG